jgi:hypothetical protein
VDAAAAADRLIDAYNRQDFDELERLIDPAVDFTHYNRGFAVDDRAQLLDVLRLFAGDLLEERHFERPERVTTAGNVCVREDDWVALPRVDIEAIGATAGTPFRLRLCTVLRFDDTGTLLEWKDHG